MLERIVIDKSIMHGKPVVKGTHVPVDIVVGSLASGMTFEEIQKEYGLQLEDIRVPFFIPSIYGIGLNSIF